VDIGAPEAVAVSSARVTNGLRPGRRLARVSLWISSAVFVAAFLAVQAHAQAAAVGQTRTPVPTPAPTQKAGKQMYDETCAACHGVDGKGRDRPSVGFDYPLPDFTDCSYASREQDQDWVGIAHVGGPLRAFTPIMPAFGDALNDADLLRIIGHIRTFCTDPKWPRGELNLPRAFLTEKAYPEDEAVVTAGVTTNGSRTVDTAIIYEKRFGSLNQIELKLPIAAAKDASGAWSGGAGDIAAGFKRTLAHSLERGSIIAASGEITFPTGDESAGLGTATPLFETFVSFGQMLPANAFVQGQAGIEMGFRPSRAEKESFWRVALGQTLQQPMFGRTWTPILEIAATREIERGAPINWDVVPQVQVSLSRRQHVLMSVGLQMPLGPRNGRQTQFLIYFLWDWFDGGLFSGW